MKQQSSECELVGTINRHGAIKDFTCLELPVLFIHKPIGEWMCKSCASNLLNGTEDY